MRKSEIKNLIFNNRLNSRRNDAEPGGRDVAAVFLFIFLFPYIVSFFFGNVGRGMDEGGDTEQMEADAGNGASELSREDIDKAEFIVCNTTEAGMEKMPLETYLVSRLPATVPMEYEMETLKAQAVVLRTELLRRYYDTRDEQQKDGKCYIYVESNIVQTDGAFYEKCKEAVGSTRGMYLTYEGCPVRAPYFAVSAGATRNGNEVFGNQDYGYLKSVICGRDFTSEDYVHSLRVSRDIFMEKLLEIEPEAVWEKGQTLEEAFPMTKDRAGYIAKVDIGGKTVSGERIRMAFLLNSSCFEWREEGDDVIIKTKGVGHGLGLCQYGANEAAKKGSDFIDILNYFFSGVVIEKTE